MRISAHSAPDFATLILATLACFQITDSEPMELTFSERLQRAWQRYKDKAEYQSAPFPFSKRRKTLFAKLHDDLLALVVLGGFIWLIYRAIIYLAME